LQGEHGADRAEHVARAGDDELLAATMDGAHLGQHAEQALIERTVTRWAIGLLVGIELVSWGVRALTAARVLKSAVAG
jgi:hypothetical protein